MTVDDAKSELDGTSGNFKCAKLIAVLKDLGFTVTKKANGNHYKVSHAKLGNFFGSNFSCRHGRNPQVLPVYVRNMRGLIVEFEDELGELND